MAHNFKIHIHRTIDNLQIRLLGDFDGSSACELVKALKENLNSCNSILIDTNNLQEIYPFGREVFYYNFKKLQNQRIRFVGRKTLNAAPY